jgi:hypothetical protein
MDGRRRWRGGGESFHCQGAHGMHTYMGYMDDFQRWKTLIVPKTDIIALDFKDLTGRVGFRLSDGLGYNTHLTKNICEIGNDWKLMGKRGWTQIT